MARWAFLGIYGLSGAAALLYQVAWSRLLTLHMGHTVAAVGTVLAAFMGGLAAGAALGGRMAPRLEPRRALVWYARLELAIAGCALLIAPGLAALQPLLRWAYADGTGALFGVVRTLSTLLLIAVPALAMGATLPLAMRWFGSDPRRAGGEAGILYALNTLGAAAGAAATGFLLLPLLGLWTTTLVGVAVNVGAAAAAFWLCTRSGHAGLEGEPGPKGPGLQGTRGKRRPKGAGPRRTGRETAVIASPWLGAAVLAITGFVALLYELVWTRAFALVLGPTTYAFSTMLVVFITGIALGSAAASRVADKVRHPLLWLVAAVMTAAVGAVAASIGVERIPIAIADVVARPDVTWRTVLVRELLLVAPLLLPSTVAFGAAFPFAVAATVREAEPIPATVARLYTSNTIGAIAGALTGSFALIPLAGLQRSVVLGVLLLVAAGVAATLAATSRVAVRAGVCAAAVALIAAGLFQRPWNPYLMSSGAYKYATDAAADPQSSLEAGELQYYGEGAGGIVTVRRVAGTTSLAIDGKVDASNGADMLTQKLLAHVPLMLHPSPRTVAVVGLGSGVTAGAALQHPVARVDTIEISPEVVAASEFFAAENRGALTDRRTRVIVADGRTHLALTSETYDVIISEPSNPWMAGVAALFTREFLVAAQARLAPGGILCQWAHTYDISEDDLRSIVATFASVFPRGAMWLVGSGDLLLVGANEPVVDLLPNMERAWMQQRVAADLESVGLRSVFALFSLFAGAGDTLRKYGGTPLQTDDRLALEFSAPRAVYVRDDGRILETLQQLTAGASLPSPIASASADATPAMWRDLGLMHLDARAADRAYDALARALEMNPNDDVALAALARAATAAGRREAARTLMEHLAARNRSSAAVRIALSRLLASDGDIDAATAAALEAAQIDPASAAAREQLASVLVDAGDPARLEGVVAAMTRDAPKSAAALYYEAALHFLRGEFSDAAAAGEQAVAANPSNARAHNLLGGAFASLGQRDRARAAFEAAVRADPRDPAALTNLGRFELESSNPRAAIGRFAEALLLDPASPRAREGLAEALERTGQSARADRLRR